jgi:phosphatidylinositol phospholipase C delta
MSSQGITEGISRHLSSLRMNTMSTRRASIDSPNLEVPYTSQVQETPIVSDIPLKSQEQQEPFDPLDPASYPFDVISPGIDMIRVTRRKRVRRLFKLNLPTLTLTWNSKVASKVEMDKIQSIRIGNDAKNYREEFNVSSEFHDLWITVIYISSSSSSSSYSSNKLKSTTGSLCNDLKALHMIAPTKRNYDLMIKILNLLSKWSKDQESLINCANIDEFSTIKWNKKVKKLDRQVLSFDDVLKLTQELHVYMNVSYLKIFFNQCDTEKNNSLNFEQFQKFVSKLRQRPEFNIIFNELGIKDNNKIYKNEFIKFIKTIQLENFDDSTINLIFEKFSYKNNRIYMTSSNLSNYLNSSYSKPLIDEENLDLNYYNYPLTDYFILSSHNTYLLGKQFHGNSSIEGYIHALQRGCRCIEIDVWDGESNPIVTHGRTLTNSIDFKLVIDFIRKYAFIASPYPLLISLEIKCSKESQLKCVSIMKSIFGDMLITLPLNNESILPSPNDLKHKILIKVKKSNSTIIIEPNLNSIHSSFSTSSTQSDDLLYSKTDTNDEFQNSNNSSSSSSSSSSIKKLVPRTTSKTTVIPELTLIAPYLVGTKYINFSLPESKTFNHVFSFSDRSLILLLRDKTKLLAILKHNRRGMMRIYPSVVRFRSDNFNPIKFWELGCQMVATNWQIWDTGQEICESFFESIGSDIGYSGYRLKPKSLRKFDVDPNINIDKEKVKLQNLNSLIFKFNKKIDIYIISAQQLPKPKEISNTNDAYTPWVEIEIYNVKPKHGEIVKFEQHSNPLNDGTEESDNSLNIIDENERNYEDYHKTKNAGIMKMNNVDLTTSDPIPNVVFKTRLAENPDNAFNPRWNVSCKLNYLTNENDLSFIRILVKTTRINKSKSNNVISKVGNAVVKNTNDYIIGRWCCKISDLKQGYRQIRLVDNKGEELIYSSMLIKVTK